jgi:hypothetical protein
MQSTDTLPSTKLAHTRDKMHWQVNDSPGDTLAGSLNPVHHAAVPYGQLSRNVLDDEKLPGRHFSQDHLDVWRGVAVVVVEGRVAERFYCHQVSMHSHPRSGPSEKVIIRTSASAQPANSGGGMTISGGRVLCGVEGPRKFR